MNNYDITHQKLHFDVLDFHHSYHGHDDDDDDVRDDDIEFPPWLIE